ncbi:hypothetical protein PLEOSDRAFT_1043442, partial [Pleurotus ostreatus PC15]
MPRRDRDPDDPGDNRGRDHRPRRRDPPDEPNDPDGPGGPGGQDRRRRSPPPPERWQINHKIPLSSLPEWNGKGKTLIHYLTDLTSYSDLDELMKSDIAQVAPTRFTHAAKDWFTTLPSEARRAAMSSFDEFILCLREHFMDAHWIDERTIEYEEMRFRQPGHTRETPLQFFQRRLKYSRFLFSENDENDVGMVHRVLRAQPACWAIHLNTESCNMVVELIRKLKVMNEGLIADWERSESHRRPRSLPAADASSSRRFYSRKSVAHNAEGEASEGSRSPSPSQDAYAVDSRRRSETRDKWPRGGTWEGYTFKRDDSKESDPPPRDQGCWICTSPRHVHRDCPHYQKWDVMR